jgi:hypothetical protein
MIRSRRCDRSTARFRKSSNGFPGQECEEPEGRPEEDCSLKDLLALGAGAAYYEYDLLDSHRAQAGGRRGERLPRAGTRRCALSDLGEL